MSELRRGCSHSESKDEMSLCNSKNTSLFSCERERGKKTILVSCGDKALLLLVCFFCLLFFMALLHPLVYALSLLRFFLGGVACGKAKTAVAQRRRFLANSLGYLPSKLFCCCFFQSSFFFFFVCNKTTFLSSTPLITCHSICLYCYLLLFHC